MTYEEAKERVGGLSNPSKMPTLSWSTPAKACKLGAKLARMPGTTCHGCYALKGFYRMKATAEATERRLLILEQALDDEWSYQEFMAAWDTIFAHRLKGRSKRDDGRYWRWHDSGDLQSVDHLILLNNIARRNPEVQFWLPTREEGMVREFLGRGLNFEPNLMVRVSVPRVDRKPTKGPAAWDDYTYSGVHTSQSALEAMGMDECQAPKQEGKCLDCRACWHSPRSISYAKH